MTLSKARLAVLRRLYGLTGEQYEEIFKQQSGRCAICDRSFTPRRIPQVDHDHRSGLVRGLLCEYCNYRVIGTLRDEPNFYSRAAAYLRYPPAVTAIGEHYTPDAPPPPTSRAVGGGDAAVSLRGDNLPTGKDTPRWVQQSLGDW